MDYYQEQMGEIVSTAKFGDLIQFEYPMGYSHWGVFEEDGHVMHFAVADETRLMSNVRQYLQSAVQSMAGDLLLGQTMIRRMPLAVVTVPDGARVLISNSFHEFEPSSKEAMQNRLTGLLNAVFPYDLFSFNCEHFATFVRYGKAVCNQIPGRSKNKECEGATELFQDTIASKRISQDLFKL